LRFWFGPLSAFGPGNQAARAAGIYAVGLTTTRPLSELDEAGADEVVDTLIGSEVARLIGRHQARIRSA
jgi:hypothetical protein